MIEKLEDMIFISYWLLIIFLIKLLKAQHALPLEFFNGAQPRPKLEIIKPQNGEVLDERTVKVNLRLAGYEPSSFHESKVCISLVGNAGESAEQCFEQTPELVYHVDGLSPGRSYSIRVAYYERGKAIAVSVRNFRIAGIIGLVDGSDKPVDISTALQMAMKLQTDQMTIEAENIYRKVHHNLIALYLMQ